MAGDNNQPAERPAKRPKRTYRACWPCRSRKLKCSFGDPNLPWDGPCERCMRERRECVQATATFVKNPVPRKSDLVNLAAESISEQARSPPPKPQAARNRSDSVQGPSESSLGKLRSTSVPGPAGASAEYSRGDDFQPFPQAEAMKGPSDDDDDDELGDDSDTLVSSNLQNPSDALKLLANASSLQYHRPGQETPQSRANSKAVWRGNNASMWSQWEPIQERCLTVQDARALFSFYELEMAPLYPLLYPSVFEPHYLETLVKSESFLLASIIVIAARYSNVLANDRGRVVHRDLSQWVRQRVLAVMDGEPALRSVSSVEALLLLSEWPMLPVPKTGSDLNFDPPSEEALLLKPSVRYDAYSWAYIGVAVRLAQELGIHDFCNLSTAKMGEKSWKQSRMLKTWVYCYNADRHIAIRLGRNAVLQAAMSSRWWESFSALVCDDDRGPTSGVWTSDAYTLGCVAQLLATIQDHLYPSKEVTRSLLKSGVWEGFLRSFRLEIRYTKRACQAKLSDDSIEAALLRIELDYVVLYAYSLSLRALQGKLRRRRQANDLHYHSPSLLNMVEGPWIMEALSAARSIIEITLSVLEERGMLRYCPSRIFQYILFATTFLYKALAAGMVEYGQQSVSVMLDRVVTALGNAAIDEEHFLHGFAVLLKRLGKHWLTTKASASPSVFNKPGDERIEAAVEEEANSDAHVMRDSVKAPTTGLTTSGNVARDELPVNPLQSFQFDVLGLDQPNDPAHIRAHAIQSGPPGTAFQSPQFGGPTTLDDLTWNFDPHFEMPAADHEQDMLFQSIWDNTQHDASVSTSNLYATLLGDALSFPEGFEAM